MLRLKNKNKGVYIMTLSDESALNQALILAAASGDVVAIRNGLEKNAQVDAVDEFGRTALHWAAFSKACSVEGLTLLLNCKASVNKGDGHGDTALHRVSSAAKTYCLIQHGADIEAKNSSGRTPLFLVSNYEALNVLLESGANINAQDELGSTSLHQAAQSGDVEKIIWLLKNGAISIKNNYGRTPLEVAKLCKKEEAVKILTSPGLFASVDSSVSSVSSTSSILNALPPSLEIAASTADMEPTSTFNPIENSNEIKTFIEVFNQEVETFFLKCFTEESVARDRLPGQGISHEDCLMNFNQALKKMVTSKDDIATLVQDFSIQFYQKYQKAISCLSEKGFAQLSAAVKEFLVSYHDGLPARKTFSDMGKSENISAANYLMHAIKNSPCKRIFNIDTINSAALSFKHIIDDNIPEFQLKAVQREYRAGK